MPIFKKFLCLHIWTIFWKYFKTHFEFLNFLQKLQNTKMLKILKTVLGRADYANFGCHNSIRLEAEHFLNNLALTFISFLGCFVFAVQKNYLFFASDPLVVIVLEL